MKPIVDPKFYKGLAWGTALAAPLWALIYYFLWG